MSSRPRSPTAPGASSGGPAAHGRLPAILAAVWWLAPGHALMTSPAWPMHRAFVEASRAVRPDEPGRAWVARTLATLRYRTSLATGSYAPEVRAALARVQHDGALVPGDPGHWRLHPAWWETVRAFVEIQAPGDLELLRDMAASWAAYGERQREAARSRPGDRAVPLR